MKGSRRSLPKSLPLAIFLFDVLATLMVLSRMQSSEQLYRHYSHLLLLPGSLLFSGGSAVAFNVGLGGLIEWLLSRKKILVRNPVEGERDSGLKLNTIPL
jgi:hypothetical protein